MLLLSCWSIPSMPGPLPQGLGFFSWGATQCSALLLVNSGWLGSRVSAEMERRMLSQWSHAFLVHLDPCYSGSSNAGEQRGWEVSFAWPPGLLVGLRLAANQPLWCHKLEQVRECRDEWGLRSGWYPGFLEGGILNEHANRSGVRQRRGLE